MQVTTFSVKTLTAAVFIRGTDRRRPGRPLAGEAEYTGDVCLRNAMQPLRPWLEMGHKHGGKLPTHCRVENSEEGRVPGDDAAAPGAWETFTTRLLSE